MRLYIALFIQLLVLLNCFTYYKTKYKKLCIALIFIGGFISGSIIEPLPFEEKLPDYLMQFISVIIVLIFVNKHRKKEQQN